MSDYILPEVWEIPASMGGAWGASINQPLVADLNSICQKVISLSNYIHWERQTASRRLSC